MALLQLALRRNETEASEDSRSSPKFLCCDCSQMQSLASSKLLLIDAEIGTDALAKRVQSMTRDYAATGPE